MLNGPSGQVTIGRHRGLQNTARRTVRDRTAKRARKRQRTLDDEPVAVGRGSRPEGKERGREREGCMDSNESRAMKKSQRSREDKRGDASI